MQPAPPTLAVETAFPNVSVALRTGDRIFEPRIDMSRARAAALQAAVADVLEQAGIGARELGGILVDVGPGSYTGLRVGLAMVRTFAMLVDLEVRALFAPDLVAMRARNVVGADREFAVAADARRGQWFLTRYRFDGDTLVRLAEPICLKRDDFVEAMAATTIAVSTGDDIPGVAEQQVVETPHAREIFDLESLSFVEAVPTPRYLMPAI